MLLPCCCSCSAPHCTTAIVPPHVVPWGIAACCATACGTTCHVITVVLPPIMQLQPHRRPLYLWPVMPWPCWCGCHTAVYLTVVHCCLRCHCHVVLPVVPWPCCKQYLSEKRRRNGDLLLLLVSPLHCCMACHGALLLIVLLFGCGTCRQNMISEKIMTYH